MVRGNRVEYNCNGNPVNLCLSSWTVLWLLSQKIIWQLYFEQFLKKWSFMYFFREFICLTFLIC